ncbi:MAG: hypothetical protein DRR16_03940 [Candidatus Parabeggiatoa sp. nov. 3]|nr:MAG: hypothetical protein DRR00_16580 [Gammaproteobacteria bacterium]RKZ59751.1 MAG: hypothetical protein DRQ99_23230 [Gammaproteobacteria bacterium]RKZ88863.1 MAG: hypothetical protein DRR16_03940 [Gammaproteobacteria bacterium]
MRSIAISMDAIDIIELLRQAYKENLILKAPDGHEFILAELNDFDREIELTRQNEPLMAFLERRARQTKTVPLDDVKIQLGLSGE